MFIQHPKPTSTTETGSLSAKSPMPGGKSVLPSTSGRNRSDGRKESGKRGGAGSLAGFTIPWKNGSGSGNCKKEVKNREASSPADVVKGKAPDTKQTP